VEGWVYIGPWVYTLLTWLEKPLTPDVWSSLRDLALFCAHQRLEIASKVEAIEAGGVPDDNIAALNLFICLVAKYFDQGDLVDREEE
jgi:survival of motor neuron protein-interacting protein 1